MLPLSVLCAEKQPSKRVVPPTQTVMQHIGMIRADDSTSALDAAFRPAHVRGAEGEVYVWRFNPLVILEVEFEFVGEERKRIVRHISQPYLSTAYLETLPQDTATESIGWDTVCAIESIRVGSTRQDLERLFSPVGFSGPDSGRFVYRKNRLIQLDATFECSQDSQGRSVFGKDDKIVRLSKPYLSSTFPQD